VKRNQFQKTHQLENQQLVFFFPHPILFPGAFMFYCALSTVGLLLFWWLLPETKGRTLEEMEVVFSRPRTCPRPWDSWKMKKSKTGDSGACPEAGGESSKNVQYVQIRGLNRDRKELEEEDD
jgi:hypothetical protein